MIPYVVQNHFISKIYKYKKLDFLNIKPQTYNEKLCSVRKVFDEFNLISGLHSFMSEQDEIYKNILPPLRLLDEKNKKKLIENLDKLDFNLKNLKAA